MHFVLRRDFFRLNNVFFFIDGIIYMQREVTKYDTCRLSLYIKKNAEDAGTCKFKFEIYDVRWIPK